MSMFTLAISCLTTSNLPWFVDLTFQVPRQCCYLQHRLYFHPPDTSTTERHFHFWPSLSFFLELFLCSSPVTYWILSDLEASSSGVIFFCPLILFTGFSRQEYRNGLLFPPPVDHVLSELSARTHPFWVALRGVAHGFFELRKPLRCNRSVVHEGELCFSTRPERQGWA